MGLRASPSAIVTATQEVSHENEVGCRIPVRVGRGRVRDDYLGLLTCRGYAFPHRSGNLREV